MGYDRSDRHSKCIGIVHFWAYHRLNQGSTGGLIVPRIPFIELIWGKIGMNNQSVAIQPYSFTMVYPGFRERFFWPLPFHCGFHQGSETVFWELWWRSWQEDAWPDVGLLLGLLMRTQNGPPRLKGWNLFWIWYKVWRYDWQCRESHQGESRRVELRGCITWTGRRRLLVLKVDRNGLNRWQSPQSWFQIYRLQKFLEIWIFLWLTHDQNKSCNARVVGVSVMVESW